MKCIKLLPLWSASRASEVGTISATLLFACISSQLICSSIWIPTKQMLPQYVSSSIV
ncbi:hypothetical protein PVAP13_7NG436098 [Panicum virgatum]|uniref:Uncharacterized protein n=1 Tax=Panicum virgatum TaxID=38727 RepID=A0A8T0Q735_PANVG|nr:hypothetical protein PVAP13_7NG436098 [Panicum virgatum]